MQFVALKDYHLFLRQGEQFLQTALKGAHHRPEVFTPEIIYNIAAMAIEKFLMGFLMSRGDLADNHTMTDLIASVERHVHLDSTLTAKLLAMDAFQEICALDTYTLRKPTTEDLLQFLSAGQEVRDFVSRLVTSRPAPVH